MHHYRFALALLITSCAVPMGEKVDEGTDTGGLSNVNSDADTDADADTDTDADADADADADTDADTEGATIAPTAGHWTFEDIRFAVSDCSAVESLIPLEEIEGLDIQEVGTSGFFLGFDQLEDGVDCVLSGPRFSCDHLDYTEVFDEFSVTLEARLEFGGRMQTTDQANAQATIEANCSGWGCELAESYLLVNFPCSFVLEGRMVREH